jgi:hypothetical protein
VFKAMFFGDRPSGLNLGLGSKAIARSGRRRAKRRLQVAAEVLRLEARCMLSGGVPIPGNPEVPLKEIFWNGGPPISRKSPFTDSLPSPEAAGAAKTIMITNYGTTTIYPFLRTENTGKDPHSNDAKTKFNQYYDPQDVHGAEFREYVGYTDTDGSKDLGLPSGASITFQVPLVLWDGDNVSIVTDGKYLTTSPGKPGDTIFNYDPNAKITIAGTQTVDGSQWVTSSANYPTGENPLVMFYFAPKALTVADDAPSQPAELTFRDPYLTHFITDDFQTFPLINYDVSNVNKLAAPVSLEANNVPITSGATASNNLAYYTPNEAFGWHGSSQNTTTFDPPIEAFVNNNDPTVGYLGSYFGGNGWPAFFNPDNTKTSFPSGIPSGANIFDLSPLDVHGALVHTSHFDSNRWLLTSSGGGAIEASASGEPVTDANATSFTLSSFSSPEQRRAFVADITSMEASRETINFGVSTDKPLGVVGTLATYDPSSKVTDLRLDQGGSDYGPDTQMVISGGGGTGAHGVVRIGKNGEIDSIGFLQDWGGSGYTSAPTITFMDPSGQGHGAEATAVISGGTITVNLTKPLPVNTPFTFEFKRTATDYASQDITNLWYSWAHYYVEQFASFGKPETLTGSQVYGSIGDKTGLLTNAITLSSLPTDPAKALAVGMGVTSDTKGILPAGTTILSIVGNTVYLSQVPSKSADKTQQYTFSAPKELPINATSAKYTKPYELSFNAAAKANADLFAGSVYESMQTQSVDTPPSAYLPDTMNVVAHVIKFWAALPTYTEPWGTELVGQIRDLAKSILRGVYNYYAVPDQSQWYPNPAVAPVGLTSGQTFNVFNLDPYVWFAHTQEGLSGYAFSVDDDVANPSATGPAVAADGGVNHDPDNLQIGFAGIIGTGDQIKAPQLANQSEWFPTTKWGALDTTATIGIEPADAPAYPGSSFITLTGTDPMTVLRTLNQIITPGPGQIGAYISAPGYIVPGTTLIYFPNGVDDAHNPTVILSQNAISTTGDSSIPVVISAGQMTLPKATVNNPSFANPPQTSPPYYTTNPTGPEVGWTFSGTAGIAGSGSVYTTSNPPPIGEQQVAFIQDQGSISQSVNLVPGAAYAVSFVVAEQALDNGTVSTQSLDVGVGSQLVGTFTPSPANGGSYVLFTSNAFTVPTAGSYALTITGKSPAGSNNTALIGTVTVTGGVG